MNSLAQSRLPGVGSGGFPLAEALSVGAGLAGLAALMFLISLMSAPPQAASLEAGSPPPRLAVSSAQALEAARAGTSVPEASAVFAGREMAPGTAAPTF